MTGAAGPPSPDCLFCRVHGAPASPGTQSSPGASGIDDELVVARRPLAYVILNRYPYNNGHLMVAPHRHIPNLTGATDDELVALMRLTRDAERVLTDAYQPHGINLGVNLGRPAGAGIVDHVHIHLVPRWNGDTSFMSVVGNVRVLPEELGQTAARLRPLFDKLV